MNPSSEHEENAGDQANVNNGKWTPAEHAIFLEAIKRHGSDWVAIGQEVGSRTPSQVRSHAQKYYNKISNDQEKIGYNTSVIIGPETESTRTRSKVVKEKTPVNTPKKNRSRQEADNSGAKVPVPKKSIKKEKKPTRPQHAPQDEREIRRQSEMTRSLAQVRISEVFQGQKPMISEPVSESQTASLWVASMTQRLREPGLDLSGMHAINECGFGGAFRRVNH